MTVLPAIPVIDVSPLYQSSITSPEWLQCAALIDNACKQYGFFYIVNHTISNQRMQQIYEQTVVLFNLPLQDKLTVDITKSEHHRGYGILNSEQLDPTSTLIDCKETYTIGLNLSSEHQYVQANKPYYGTNIYPNAVPTDWIQSMEQHYSDLHALSLLILRSLTVYMKVDIDYFDNIFRLPCCTLRLLHYPPSHSSAQQITAGAHTDYGCITLLQQCDIGGLQIRFNNEWIDVPVIPNTYVVNIGDMMSRYSNGIYKSALHRVVALNKTQHRYSIAYFADPATDTVVQPLTSYVTAETPARYEPITYGDYLTSRFAATYEYLHSKQNTDSKSTE